MSILNSLSAQFPNFTMILYRSSSDGHLFAYLHNDDAPERSNAGHSNVYTIPVQTQSTAISKQVSETKVTKPQPANTPPKNIPSTKHKSM